LDHGVQSGTDLDFEHRFRMPDSSVRYVHVVAHAVRDQSGNLEYVGSAMDVTEQQQAKAALEKAVAEIKKSEAQLQMIIETIPALVWCASPDGELTDVNQRILDYTGVSLGELAQAGWVKFLHPDDVRQTLTMWTNAVRTGNPHDVQYRLRRHDGTYRWF